MWTRRYRLVALLVLALCAATTPPAVPAQTSGQRGARPAPPEVVAELQRSIERARQRLEARDANGVLAYVSEHYRSQGLTKADVGQQLHAMCTLYEQLRARVTIDQARIVDGVVWVYTTGEVSGRLPFVGWVPTLRWTNQPEVARNEGSAWRLFGFQD
ncbi:MAG: hypothetical protein ACREKS_04120 [Candidatus Rokuibacteriota bacterium]